MKNLKIMTLKNRIDFYDIPTSVQKEIEKKVNDASKDPKG